MITTIAKSVARKNPYIPNQDWEDLVQEVELKKIQKPRIQLVFKSIMIDFLRQYTPLFNYRGKKNELVQANVGLNDSTLDGVYKETPRDLVVKNEEIELVKEAVLLLNPTYQRIIYLKFFEDFTFQKLAEMEGCQPANIFQKYNRSLANLRKILEPIL